MASHEESEFYPTAIAPNPYFIKIKLFRYKNRDFGCLGDIKKRFVIRPGSVEF